MKKLVIGLVATTMLLFAATAGAVAEKVLNVGVGDVLFVKNTHIACSVANPYKQMVCFKRNASGHAVPGTFGTTASDKFAAVVRFNKKGTPVIVVKKNN